MKKAIFFLSLLSCSSLLYAQVIGDAVRYTQLDFGGSTARSLGVAGSLSALGTEFATISTNPAGLAMYRGSEFILTPGYSINGNEGNLVTDSDPRPVDTRDGDFGFFNVGAVFATRPLAAKWKQFNVGLGFNRLADFHENFSYGGSSPGTIIDRFLEQANAEGVLNSFESELAFLTVGIYDDYYNGGFTSDFANIPFDFPITKEQDVERSGSISEMLLAFGGNYDEKLMIGVSFGFPFLNYQETKTYRERDTPTDEIPFFNELEFTERLSTTGVGINAKLGLIYRFSQAVRFGVAVHSPTVFGLDDNFSNSFTYYFTDANSDVPRSQDSPEGRFDYRLRTPWRVIGSAGILLGQSGFLTGEVEWVDYKANDFNLTVSNDATQADADYEADLEALMSRELTSSITARVGGEVVLDMFQLRAGVSVRTSPYDDLSDSNVGLSVGAGLRREQFYLDLGYRYTTATREYIPYLVSQAPEQLVSVDGNLERILFTFGYKF